MSCKRKFRELKTANEKKFCWKNPKSRQYGTKWSCYKLFTHSALHSRGTVTKSATRLGLNDSIIDQTFLEKELNNSDIIQTGY